MIKKILLTISLFTTITNVFCQEGKLEISPIPITLFENPSSNIFDLAQDKFGNIWMAHAQDGIVRYDGVNTEWYAPNAENPDAIVGGRLEGVFIDKEGYIWISTFDKGLEKFDPETEIFTHYKHDPDNPKSIRSNKVRSFLQDEEGFIWIGTVSGLDKYNPDSGEFNHIFSKDPDTKTIDKAFINQLYQDQSGIIWIGCGTAFNNWKQYTGGLFKYDKKTDEITPYLHTAENNSLLDNRITALHEDSRGTFWVGTAGDGLHTMDRRHGTFKRHEYDLLNPRKLSRPPLGDLYTWSDDFISFIEEDEFGNIWIGTYEGGINRYNPASGTTTYFGMDEFGTESFFSSLKTQDNLLWIGAWGNNISGENLFKVNTSFQGLEYRNVGTALRIGAMVETGDQSILISTSRGLWLMDTKGDIQNLSLNNDYLRSNPKIRDLEKNKSGNIWISTSQGLYYYNVQTKVVTEYRHNPNDTNSISTDDISTTLQIDDKVFIATELGVNVLNLNNGIFKRYLHDANNVNTLVNDKVRALEQDHQGNIWIGTVNGINKFDASTGLFKRYEDSLLNINSIFEDSKQSLWASSKLKGLLRYDEVGDGFVPYFDKTGILTPGISTVDIAEDNNNNLWTKTNLGFLRLNPSNGKAILFGKSWGINAVSSGGGQSQGILTTSDGDILFGNHNGIVRFIPKYFQKEVSTFDPHISKFYIDNQQIRPGTQEYLPKPVSQANEITLKNFQNNFAFEFGHADFQTAPTEHLVQYQLKNYDNNWRNSNGENKAAYYEVPSGKYVFQVRASNIYGIRTEKSLAITILPPWYKTYWAYAFYVLMLIVGIYAVHRIQKDRIVKAEREKARTKELEQAREIEKAYTELGVAHENLKSTQFQLIQSEKMASLGELTAGIAHEIQNPLNFVNNFSEVSSELVEELKAERLKEKEDRDENLENEILDDIELNLSKINHHGERASGIVKGMLEHSRTGDSVKEPTDINALADEYLRLAYHGMRAKDKSFNAEFKTDFDPSLPKVEVVPQDIGRVLLNLINNAFYAVSEKAARHPEQSRNLSADRQESGAAVPKESYKPEVVVSTRKLDGKIEISVQDNGEGIPEQVREKIFQPFFTTKPTGSGTGLGLSLSYDIVKAHGGEIKVETKNSEGTYFTIHLPIDQ